MRYDMRRKSHVMHQAWDNPTQNHVWGKEELHERLSEQPKHTPNTALDRVIQISVRGCYHAFNFVTRFNKKDPSPAACEYEAFHRSDMPWNTSYTSMAGSA